jgi:quinol monooxygenase YgiN
MGWAQLPAQPTLAPRARAVCATLRAEARRGSGGELERLVSDFSRRVRAKETGCLSYVLTRALGSRTQFVIHARFSSWGAFREHGETVHMRQLLPRLNSLLAAPVSVEIFLEV